MTSHGNRTFRTHNISLTLAGGMNSQKHEDEKQIIARNIQYKHNNGKSRIEKQYFFFISLYAYVRHLYFG